MADDNSTGIIGGWLVYQILYKQQEQYQYDTSCDELLTYLLPHQLLLTSPFSP